MIELVASKNIVILAQLLVHTKRENVLPCKCFGSSDPGLRTGIASSPSRQRQSVARVERAYRVRLRGVETRGVLPKTHQLVVIPRVCRVYGINIRLRRRDKRRGWGGDRVYVGQQESQTFVVYEEEGLVLDNGATK